MVSVVEGGCLLRRPTERSGRLLPLSINKVYLCGYTRKMSKIHIKDVQNRCVIKSLRIISKEKLGVINPCFNIAEYSVYSHKQNSSHRLLQEGTMYRFYDFFGQYRPNNDQINTESAGSQGGIAGFIF